MDLSSRLQDTLGNKQRELAAATARIMGMAWIIEYLAVFRISHLDLAICATELEIALGNGRLDESRLQSAIDDQISRRAKIDLLRTNVDELKAENVQLEAYTGEDHSHQSLKHADSLTLMFTSLPTQSRSALS